MTFYTLIHVCREEQSLHNNAFGTRGFEAQIKLYLDCAKQLHRSLATEGMELIVLTNDEALLQKLNDGYPITVTQLNFKMHVPPGIKFYSAHFKLEVFSYLASLKEEYTGLVDSDVLCINGLPEAFKTIINEKIPLYYDITDQVTPAYGANKVRQDKERISGEPSVGLWAGGEFLAGPPSFFGLLFEEVSAVKETYWHTINTLHHQGDEVLTSVAVEKIKRQGKVPLLDAGVLSFVGRYWSYVPLHAQKPVEGYAAHFLLHLPSDKKFIARLQPDEMKGAAFFKKYKRHLSVARTMESVFKNIKPYAKRIRKKLAF